MGDYKNIRPCEAGMDYTNLASRAGHFIVYPDRRVGTKRSNETGIPIKQSDMVKFTWSSPQIRGPKMHAKNSYDEPIMIHRQFQEKFTRRSVLISCPVPEVGSMSRAKGRETCPAPEVGNEGGKIK